MKYLNSGIYLLTFYLFLCSAVFTLPVNASPLDEPVPLATALKQITLQYKVNFLYEERNISSKKVSFSAVMLKGKGVEEVLTMLLSPVGLTWSKIDAKNYSIFPALHKGQRTVSGINESGNVVNVTDTITYSRISGRLTDHSGHGVEFSTLSLLRPLDSVSVKKVLSDTSGNYLFTDVPAGEYVIKASAIGYQPALSDKFTLTPGTILNIPSLLIQSLPQTLTEVKIRASKAVVETKGDRFIFNVANSAMAVGSSIDLLKSAPFVKVAADNSISLQGKKTMILIDNKPVAETALENILRTLPAGNISQVELITHPSAKYDAAYGAVINIVTKKNKIEGFTGNVIADGSAGLYGMASLNTAVAYKYKGLTVYGTGGLIKGDDLFSITSDRTVSNGGVPDVLGNNWKRLTHNKMYSFQVGGDLELGKDQTIGLVVNGGINYFKGPWTTANTFKKQGGAIDSVLYTNASFHQPMSTYSYNLNYHLLRDSGKNELTILTTFTPWKRNLQQYFPSVMYNSAGEVQNTPATYQTTNTTDINVYIAQADFSHAFNKQWKLETGLKYQHTNSKNAIDYERDNGAQFVNIPAYSSNNELNESISGLYGILSKDWKSDKLQFGVRTEQTSASFTGGVAQNYFNAFPTLLYQHNINDNNNVSFSFKRTIARAQYYELVPYSVFINQYTVEQGNPALKPEYDNLFSIGTNIHKLNLSLNYTSAQGMIALFPVKQDFNTKLTYFSRRNLDRTFDYSLYVFFPLRFTSWWETQNSGSILGYNKAQGQVLGAAYTLSGFHSDFKSAHIFQVAKTIKLEVDAYYWTKYVQDLSRYSGYKNIYAAVMIDMFSGKGQLRLAGSEILFKRNDYRLDHDFGTFSSRELINTDSRRVSVGFTYKFGKTTIKSPEKKLGNEDALKRL